MLTGAVPVQAAEVITYFHHDAAGTPQLATDAAGNVLWKETYRPYGERIKREAGATGNNSLWFTGKPQDVNSGLVYMGARYYEPVLGRFTGIDPAGFDEGNLHSFNRYAYGNNNPYKYVDPDGRNPVLIWMGVGAVTGGLTAGAMNAAVQYMATGQVDWGVYGVSGAAAEGAQMGMVFGPAGFAAGARAGAGKAEVEVIRSAAANAKQGADLSRHLGYAEKYGAGGVKQLENGRIRYYGEVQFANKAGEMAGARYVHEFDAASGKSRGWLETVDHAGNVRQVRPELNNGTKTHYRFDSSSKYTGSW